MAKNHLQNSIAILLALFLSLLPGCGKGEKNLNIRMDLQQEVTSLDPQFSTSWESQVVMLNLFEGLLIRGGDGELSPGAASDYTVSSDGLTYTFHLRRDGVWDDGDPADGVEPTPVTAQDFVFSFWRIFDPEVPSPWAGDFQAIRNSQEVMAGELPKTQLGVWAIGEYTLVIQLSEPSPILLEQLAGPGALPCNETFFRDTRARYGQTMSLILGNGPFSLSDWNSEAVVLVPSSRYTGPQEVLSPSVVLYTGRAKRQETTDWQLFLDGKSDFCTAAGQVEGEQNFTLLPAQDTVWALVFREEEGSPLADVDIRRALALSIDGDSFGERVPEHFQRTDSLVPHSAALMGREYRSLASSPSVTSRRRPGQLWRRGWSGWKSPPCRRPPSFCRNRRSWVPWGDTFKNYGSRNCGFLSTWKYCRTRSSSSVWKRENSRWRLPALPAKTAPPWGPLASLRGGAVEIWPVITTGSSIFCWPSPKPPRTPKRRRSFAPSARRCF